MVKLTKADRKKLTALAMRGNRFFAKDGMFVRVHRYYDVYRAATNHVEVNRLIEAELDYVDSFDRAVVEMVEFCQRHGIEEVNLGNDSHNCA